MTARRFQPLQGRHSHTTHALTQLVSRFDRDNRFNPSMLRSGPTWFMAIRHFDTHRRKPFEASLLRYNADTEEFSSFSLTQHAAEHGVDVVADPKLFKLKDEIWVTFNSGWSRTMNALYVMRVFPQAGRPIPVDYGQRNSVEKNWAFFAKGDRLNAIYSLSPFRLLSTAIPGEDTRELEFHDTSPRSEKTSADTALSIGTQPVMIGDDLYLIAHEKHALAKFRMYLGRLVRLRSEGDTYSLVVSGQRLFHSWASLLGSTTKHNKHLISCSYFSGLIHLEQDRLVLGYGINDIDLGFAEMPLNEL